MTGELVVPAPLEGERVDRAVALLTGWPRAEVQALIARGAVVVAGQAVAKSRRLREGEVVELLEEPEPEAPPTADANVAVAVVHEDRDVIVVDKPAGVVVHPGAGQPSGTLVHGLLARYPDVAGVGDPSRPGIVHRIDRDTSGLLVVARTPAAYDALVAQLAARTVERRYLALVWGRLDAPRGLVDAPVGRSPTRRTRMAVQRDGRSARTAYEVREAFEMPECSLVECRLETGRTHQIRVHFAAIGHPVVGDTTYGRARAGLELDRPFLHASVLAFDHPASGTRLRFESPLPSELAHVLARLRAGT